MVIKPKGLKRLCKEAWRDNTLTIVRMEPDGLAVSGGYWLFYAKELSRMKKEAKAAIIELAGDIPEIGVGKRIGKEVEKTLGATGIEPMQEILDATETATYRHRRAKITIHENDGLECYYSVESHNIACIDPYIQEMITIDEMSAAAEKDNDPVRLYFEDDDSIFVVYTKRVLEESLVGQMLKDMRQMVYNMERHEGRIKDAE